MRPSKVILILLGVCVSTYADENNIFFRNDYEYLDSTASFYKIHTIHKNWHGAKKTCEMEGASLFYPVDKNEAGVVMEHMSKKQPFSWVYIGASALIARGVYETIDGVPISKIYNKWAPGEPNDDYSENCVVLRRDGALQDENCASKYPFICKKTLASLTWNRDCNMPYTDYEYQAETGKCYKFHLDPQTWSDAYATCSAELSYLAIVNSEKESELLINITASAPKESVEGGHLRGAVHLGFHNRDGEDWKTVDGKKLDQSGYSNWGYGEPNGAGNEQCGSMFYTGQLNDISCDGWRMFFICEHEVDFLGMNDENFNENNYAEGTEASPISKNE